MKTMKKLKRLAFMLLCIMVIGIFTGCGSGTAPTVNNSVGSDVEPPLTSDNDELESVVVGEDDIEMLTEGDDITSGTETSVEEDDTMADVGSLEAGDTVNIERILDYISSGSEYAVVYAVKRGEEYQIACCVDDNGESSTMADGYSENTRWGLIPETTILKVSASQNDELVYFGYGSSSLSGISEYHYAAPFPLAARTAYGEETGEFTSYKKSYRTVGHYMKNKIEGPDNWDTFYSWVITEINGIPIDDVSIQDKLVEIEGYNHVYMLLNDEETIVIGGYENTTWQEAEFKCGYMYWGPKDAEFHLEGTRTKEGYTIIASGSELKALGDYTTFLYGLYGLVEVVD